MSELERKPCHAKGHPTFGVGAAPRTNRARAPHRVRSRGKNDFFYENTVASTYAVLCVEGSMQRTVEGCGEMKVLQQLENIVLRNKPSVDDEGCATYYGVH